MIIALIACILFILVISGRFIYLFIGINRKKRDQKIITPKERIQFKKWSIAFATIIAAAIIGFGSALISYL